MRWYVSSLGSEEAIHTAHWHGITFNMNGRHMDQVGMDQQTGNSNSHPLHADGPGLTCSQQSRHAAHCCLKHLPGSAWLIGLVSLQ